MVDAVVVAGVVAAAADVVADVDVVVVAASAVAVVVVSATKMLSLFVDDFKSTSSAGDQVTNTHEEAFQERRAAADGSMHATR